MEKRKQNRRILGWIALAVLVLCLAVLPALAGGSQEQEHQASILTAQVQSGTVSTGIRGGGTLRSGDTVEVELPSGVKIERFLVENGQAVSEGDPLAVVDKVTLLDAVTQVQETMEYLQKQINSASEDTVDSTLTAEAGGRVKKIYAQPGDSVQEVMLREGCLALLNLDGLMAVTLEAQTDLAVGADVAVTLEDGTEVSGQVESNLQGVVVVTVEDQGYAPDQTVTVSTLQGQALGTGALYLHSPWRITAYSGTVETVQAREDEKVAAGRLIFSLKDTDFTAQANTLAQEHREYEELLASMLQMHESGLITAPADGIVSGVDEESVHLLSGGDGQIQAQPLNNEGNQGIRLVLLADTSQEEGQDEGGGTGEGEVEGGSGSEGEGEGGGEGEGEGEGEGGDTGFYNGYGARVLAASGGQWSLIQDASPMPVDPENLGGASVSEETMTQLATVGACQVSVYQDGALVPYPGEITAGTLLLFVYDENGELVACLYKGISASAQLPSGGMGDLGSLGDLSGLMGGLGSAGTGGSTQAQVFQKFDLEGSTLLTLRPRDQMELTITVDEGDISSLYPGQEAQVTVSALNGETVSAQVTQVGSQGVNNGGSSKFTAQLTLERREDMLEGMSAQAEILLDTAENVLTVPVAALVEDGIETVVYTGYDRDAGVLTDPVEVEVGQSDGENAQILSGLEEGDTVYYAYYDTLTE